MIQIIFFILILLQIKHWYIDFVNQTSEEVAHKGIYLDWCGVKHSLKHGIATAFIFLLFAPFETALILGILDFLIHYHVDWAKMNINKKYGYTIEQPQFWAWLGADQLAHQITYIGLAYTLLPL